MSIRPTAYDVVQAHRPGVIIKPDRKDRFKMNCPIHNGDGLNLLVWDNAESGDVMVKCATEGCSSKVIAERLVLNTKENTARQGGVKGTTNLNMQTSTPPAGNPVKAIPKKQSSIPLATQDPVKGPWIYPDADGKPDTFVTRKNKAGGKKDFPQGHWDIEGNEVWSKRDGLQPLYNLHLIATGTRPLMVHEGEKSCHGGMIKFPEYDHTTWPGGSSVDQDTVNWAPIAGRVVILWPDNDDVGRQAMSDVADLLIGLGCTVRIVDTSKMPPKWDCGDAVPAGIDLQAMVAAAKIQSEWPDPLPISTMTEPMPFPVDCLERSEFKDFTAAIAHESECPVDLAITQAFATIAATIQANTYYDVTHKEHACIYAVGLAASGDRKSPIERRTSNPLQELFSKQCDEFKREVASGGSEQKVLKMRRKNLENDAAKCADDTQRKKLISQLQEMDQAAADPVSPSPLIVTEATCPGLKRKMMSDPKETVFVSDSESRIVEIMLSGAFDNGSEPDSDILRKAYTADYCNGLRGGADAVQGVLKQPTLSVGLIIPTGDIEKFFHHNSNSHNGNIARFLFSWPKSMAGKRTLHGERCPQRLTEWWNDLICDLHHKTPPDDNGRRGWFQIGATPEAIREWRKFMLSEEPKRDTERGEYALGGAAMLTWAGKLEGHVIRIAMALHAILNGSDYVDTPITETTMRNAIQITRYYIAHAIRVFSGYSVDPKMRDAVRVFRLLTSKAKDGKISLNDANRAGLNNDKKKRDATLEILESASWIKVEQIKTGKRPTTVIRLNPAAVEDAA